MKDYETSEKIIIVENHLSTFVDLLLQVQELTLTVEKKTFSNHSPGTCIMTEILSRLRLLVTIFSKKKQSCHF